MPTMTPKQRLLATMRHGKADRVPVTPDMSNMIPARLTGKPFWDVYLYQDPPLWKAYIDAAKYFGIDGFLDGQVDVRFPGEPGKPDPFDHTAIVHRTDDNIVTRKYRPGGDGRPVWHPGAVVYPRDNPPSRLRDATDFRLPATPESWEPLTGVKEWPAGEELFGLVREYMGDAGVIGLVAGTSSLVHSVEDVYAYHDDPEGFRRRTAEHLEWARFRLERIFAMKPRPDFVATGASGSLVFQTVAMFRELALPVVREVTRRCRAEGMPSHIHSCGPEAALVKICAGETDLDLIDPLEIPPMGDCDLAALKRAYGRKLVLKGNLHTVEVMLNGTYETVKEASRQAIRDAGEGGAFILSTGDQCGRDTPEANIRAMLDAAEEYGRY